MGNVLPIFVENSFKFDGEAPDHIEAYPDVPNYAGLFAVFGATREGKPYTLALDVPTESFARSLADARVDLQETDEGLYGYTDDVYIIHPDGSQERTYVGYAE